MKKDGVQIHQEQPEQEQSFFQKHWKKSLLVELSLFVAGFLVVKIKSKTTGDGDE